MPHYTALENIPLQIYNAYISYFFHFGSGLALPIILVLVLSILGFWGSRLSSLARLYLGVCLMSIGCYSLLVWADFFRMSYALMPRFIMPAAPLIFILPALAISRVERKWVRCIVALVLPCMMFFHVQSLTRYIDDLDRNFKPESIGRNVLFAKFVAANIRTDDVLLLEAPFNAWCLLCFSLPSEQTMFYGSEGTISEGILRLPGQELNPAKPRRIMYASIKSEDNNKKNVAAVLGTLFRTRRVLPRKLETDKWWVYSLTAKGGEGEGQVP